MSKSSPHPWDFSILSRDQFYWVYHTATWEMLPNTGRKPHMNLRKELVDGRGWRQGLKVGADGRGWRQGMATGQAEGTRRSVLETLELAEPAFWRMQTSEAKVQPGWWRRKTHVLCEMCWACYGSTVITNSEIWGTCSGQYNLHPKNREADMLQRAADRHLDKSKGCQWKIWRWFWLKWGNGIKYVCKWWVPHFSASRSFGNRWPISEFGQVTAKLFRCVGHRGTRQQEAGRRQVCEEDFCAGKRQTTSCTSAWVNVWKMPASITSYSTLYDLTFQFRFNQSEN